MNGICFFSAVCISWLQSTHTRRISGVKRVEHAAGKRTGKSFNMKLEFIAFNIKLFSCCGAVTADELSNVRDRPRSWELRQLQPWVPLIHSQFNSSLTFATSLVLAIMKAMMIIWIKINDKPRMSQNFNLFRRNFSTDRPLTLWKCLQGDLTHWEPESKNWISY